MIVNTMGGSIDFQSKPGEGSIFYFDIIAEVDEAGKTETNISENTGAHTRKDNRSTAPLVQSILIAEDNHNNMILIKEILTNLFPEVRLLEAATGSEAVSLYEKETPDIILMDIHMPEMDGIEAAKVIRKLEENLKNKAYIIALTADALKEKREECMAAGMDDYLTKPVVAENIRLAISRFLEKETLSEPYTAPVSPNPDKEIFETTTDPKDLPLPPKELKALVVDDLDINRSLFSKMLEKCNCRAVTAASGIEAVEIVAESDFDIVFMDIKMPGMDGIEAARKIREISKSYIPIIALTGLALEGDDEKYISLGMDGFIAKPVDLKKLCHTLDLHTGDRMSE